MALSDPQSIKIGETESSLPRVNTGGFSSQYESNDGSVTLKLSTQESNRKRHVIRVDVEKITEDPFTSNNVVVSMSSYLVIDRPIAGFDNDEAAEVAIGLIDLITASEASALSKLLGSES